MNADPVLRLDVGRGVENGEGRAVWMGRVSRLADVFEAVTTREYGDPITVIRKFAPYTRNDGPGSYWRR